jgi:D-3-phosphoglycerate dehydrogenase
MFAEGEGVTGEEVELRGPRRFRILCPEPQNYSRRGLEAAGRLARVDAAPLSQAEFAARAPFYDALMVRLQTRITGDVIVSCPNLRAIITPTTGLDHIDLDAARDRHVQVFCLKGETEFLSTITSTAEHTWALLLCLVRRVIPAHAAVSEDRWQPDQFRSVELSGRTLGVVGLGRLGTMVARYGTAFGMRVLGYDPYQNVCPSGVERARGLDELLAMSHVVTLHVPLNEQTAGLIGAPELELMPDQAYLINTSRGPIVNEQALLSALERGRLAGAAVDVLTAEHSVSNGNHPMVNYARRNRNLIITPHVGGAAEDAIERTDVFVMKRFEQWLVTA